jgi:POT family proton-dependent oligopeptide transporter
LKGGGDRFWNAAKPSLNPEASQGIAAPRHGFLAKLKLTVKRNSNTPKPWTWDDKFVDEIKQSVRACAIFAFIPIFNLMDQGFGSVENAMSAAMVNNGVPNDLISNFNPLTIIVCAPILNFVVYPFLTKRGMMPAPMTRMSIGFMLGVFAMIIGAILQWRVYETSPCGYYATECASVSSVSLWWQIPLIALPACGELFVNVTSYEIAYTKAPQNMRGLVYALCLFSSALSSALTEIVNATPALLDPYLIWSYVALAAAGTVCAIIFPIFFKDLNEVTDFSDIDRMEGKRKVINDQSATKVDPEADVEKQ